MLSISSVLSLLPIIPSLPGPHTPWGYDSADDSDDADDGADAVSNAYYANEVGQGHTGIVQHSPHGTHVSLVEPAVALARIRAAEQAARQAAHERETAQLPLEAMPRTCALFAFAAREACRRGWVQAEDLAMADWDALWHVAALALCMALQACEAPLPELFARQHLQAGLQPLRQACRDSASHPDVLRHAVCRPQSPQGCLSQDQATQASGQADLAQAIRAQAQAICLRYRASTTALLQHVCQELP